MDASNTAVLELELVDGQEITLTQPKRGPGKPTKYFTHVQPFIQEIERDLKNGILECDIYERLGVNRQSWIDYKHTYPEFENLFKKVIEYQTGQVKNALLMRALGFNHTTQKLTKSGEVVEIDEYYAPDTTAIQVWLYNRAADDWKRYGNPGLQVINNTLNLNSAGAETGKLIGEYTKLQEFASDMQNPGTLEQSPLEGD